MNSDIKPPIKKRPILIQSRAGVVNNTSSQAQEFSIVQGLLKLKKKKFRLPKLSLSHRTVICLGLSAVLFLQVLAAAVLPSLVNPDRFYKLSQQAQSVVGSINQDLSKKISYDGEKQLYQYNKEAAPQGDPGSPEAALAAAQNSQKVGGGADNYAVDLNVDPEKGVTIYDTSDKSGSLSVSLIPQFDVRAAKQKDGRVIYPLIGKSGHVVYSVKANGLKEDIVLDEFAGDELNFNYQLKLPESLDARLLDNGGVGIYSADTTLFGNISFGSDADREKVEKARKNGDKNHLVFAIPAPQIVQNGEAKGQPQSKFELKNDVLTVKASGLSNAGYPLSIDPSVVVTSATDFTKGNMEGGIDIDASGHLKRGALTGGTVPSWGTSGTLLPTNRYGHASVVYNGKLYLLGGSNGSALQTTYYASIDSSGNVGSFTAGSNLLGVRVRMEGFTYNGYLYVAGGCDADVCNNANHLNSVEYAKILPDGSIGTWANTSPFANVRFDAYSAVYNGYAYIYGGCGSVFLACTGFYADVQYAQFKADGTLSAWTTDTDSPLTSQRGMGMGMAYNGYLYSIGGHNPNGLIVEFAPINSDGTIGSWTSTTSLPVTRAWTDAVVLNGYVYVAGGATAVSGTTVDTTYYARLNANGTVGSWYTTTALPAVRELASVVSDNNGHIIFTGGQDNSDVLQDDIYYSAAPNPAGVTGTYTTNTNDYAATARLGTASVAYNGCLYVIGGNDGAEKNDLRYATINSDGTTGTWSTGGNTFNTARRWMGAVAYNGYLYLAGGQHTGNTYTTEVNYAAFNVGSCGTGAFTTGNAIGTARSMVGMTAANGYLYVAGGINNNNSTNLATVDYSVIGANGVPGAWSTTTSLGTARSAFGMAASNGYIYAAGGANTNTVEYALVCTGLNNGTGGCGATAGTVGTWNSTSSFSTARYHNSAAVYNGYFYVTGGSNLAGTYYSDTQYAQINANGSLGSFAATTSFTTGRSWGNTVAYNGVLYVIGGCSALNIISPGCDVPLKDVQIAPINNGGAGNTSTWVNDGGTSFTTNRRANSTVAYNGFLYVIGGITNAPGTNLKDVKYAPIGADGEIGTWNDTTEIDNGSGAALMVRSFHQSVVYNGYIYVIGGRSGATSLDDVRYALICTGNNNGTGGCGATAGAVGTWADGGNDFSTARLSHTAVANNGYLYVIGGCTGFSGSPSNCSSYLGDVQYAPFNSNGTVGGWTTNGTSLTTPRFGHSTVVVNNYIYVLGGCYRHTGSLGSVTCGAVGDDEYGLTNTVEYAQISGGAVGTWNLTNGLAKGKRSAASFAANGYIYIAGGQDGTGYVSTSHYAAINSNGTLGNWQAANDLNTAIGTGPGAYYNGRLYIAGGCTAGECTTTTNTVRYSGQLAIDRKGRYSSMFDLAGDAVATKLLFRGTESGGCSNTTLSYKNAPDSTDTFDTNATKAPELTSNSLYNFTATEQKYRWIQFTIDDICNSTFPDSLGTPSTLEDFELWFRPATTSPSTGGSKRLRGGKTFTDQTPRSLDAQPN